MKLRNPLKYGERFERLVVVWDKGSSEVRCVCDCGASTSVKRSRLRSGHTRSCGCLSRERIAKENWKHGESGTPLFKTWARMIERCYNKNCAVYHRYGGRGIRVCERWRNSFVLFKRDMGPKPSPKHSIDRIDNNGDYTPKNCHWATQREQNRNMHNNIILEHDGKRMCVAEWAELLGISYWTLYQRVTKLGYSAEKALTKPVRGQA